MQLYTPPTITGYNLAAMERLLVVSALKQAGNIVGAAELLGITRQKVKRNIIRHQIEYPFPESV